MINYTDTNLLYQSSRPILTAAMPLIAEGQGLVHAFEAGIAKAQPATGSNADAFLGICMGPRRTFSMNNKIETVTVPAAAPYTVLLTKAVQGLPGCYQSGGALVASGTGAASSTNVQVGTDPATGLSLLTFDSSFAGQTFNVGYSYVMSLVEENATYGGGLPGASPEQVIGQCEIIELGPVAVSNWDPKANWYAGGGLPFVKLIAGGIFTDAANAATGIVLPNVLVRYLPTSANPWLGLELK